MAIFAGIGIVVIAEFESDHAIARKDGPFVQTDQSESLAVYGAIYGFVLLSQEFLYGFFVYFAGIQQKAAKSLSCLDGMMFTGSLLCFWSNNIVRLLFFVFTYKRQTLSIDNLCLF